MATPVSTTWPLDPQTAAKHEILRRYLGGWFGVMGHTTKKSMFFDAFAGPGEYSDGKPGSPLIALDTLLNHRVLENDCDFYFLFNESQKDRYEHLLELLERSKVNSAWPKNVKVLTSNQDFMDITQEISDFFEGRDSILAPTLMFVDPFGISEAPLETLGKILKYPKCEVFAYLSVNTINRFGTAGNVDESMKALFGTEDFKNAPPAGDAARIPYFVALYEDQLKSECGFKYTRTFQMRNTSGILIYCLVYATNSKTGLQIMKDAMWGVAPDGSYSFSARYANQDVLLQVAVDYGAVAEVISNKFRNHEVAMSSVCDFVLIETPYKVSHVRRGLKVLDEAGRLTVKRIFASSSRRKGTFPYDSVIKFL